MEHSTAKIKELKKIFQVRKANKTGSKTKS